NRTGLTVATIQRDHMLDVDLTAVLDDFACERTDSAARNHSATTFICKPDLGRGLCNQCLSTAVLTISIGVFPTLPERRPFVAL
ncbi:MAG: hypothetical protein OQK02_04035, partial [Marinobacter sp.]|nr:hypothetical protein [Marinobacter sp.]